MFLCRSLYSEKLIHVSYVYFDFTRFDIREDDQSDYHVLMISILPRAIEKQNSYGFLETQSFSSVNQDKR